MTSHNDITGDKIQTKPTTKEYADNWDRIFGNCKRTPEGDLDIGACCGGSTSCTAPCMTDNCKKEPKMSGNSDQAYEDYADAAHKQPIKEKKQ